MTERLTRLWTLVPGQDLATERRTQHADRPTHPTSARSLRPDRAPHEERDLAPVRMGFLTSTVTV